MRTNFNTSANGITCCPRNIVLAAILVLCVFLADSATACTLPILSDSVLPKIEQRDSIENAAEKTAASLADDSTKIVQQVDSVMKGALKRKLPKPKFVPDPKRALWLALVIPGAGQIYNRKYWKLPIFYGGFLGCTYALMWNQQMYKDYSQAYIDIMDDDPNTHSYTNMLPPNYDITGLEDRFKTIFKNKKDRYRRWRDYAAFSFVGVYLLSVIDAYVDAQLSQFDISKDLSLNVKPTVIPVHNSKNSAAVGIGCGLNF